MAERTEEQGIAEVTIALQARFPDVAPTLIHGLVRREQALLDGPIREFVPILVEHAVRDQLRREGHRPGLLAS